MVSWLYVLNVRTYCSLFENSVKTRLNWFGMTCELHRDWRNDIEGLGNILSTFIPNYRNIMNSYLAQQKLKK